MKPRRFWFVLCLASMVSLIGPQALPADPAELSGFVVELVGSASSLHLGGSHFSPKFHTGSRHRYGYGSGYKRHYGYGDPHRPYYRDYQHHSRHSRHYKGHRYGYRYEYKYDYSPKRYEYEYQYESLPEREERAEQVLGTDVKPEGKVHSGPKMEMAE